MRNEDLEIALGKSAKSDTCAESTSKTSSARVSLMYEPATSVGFFRPSFLLSDWESSCCPMLLE